MAVLRDIIVSKASGRPDKNDVYLQELVKAQNWKQALAAIEKRLKKGKTDRLLLNKALVLCYMPAMEDHIRGMSLMRDVVERNGFISDVESCRAVEQVANLRGEFVLLQPLAAGMWTRALKARPGDEELSNEIFESKFRAQDYEAAKKVAQVCMKHGRHWYFRFVLCVHLEAFSNTSKLPERMRGMLGELAVKSLAKSAQDVIPDLEYAENPEKFSNTNGNVRIDNTDPSSKALRTTRQLGFLIEVYRRHGKHEQALAVLNDDARTGLRSSLGNTWDLVLDKIELLTICENWGQLFDFCEALLQDARAVMNKEKNRKPYLRHGKHGNDWAVWRGLVFATAKLGDPNRFARSTALINFFSGQGERNARLASIELDVFLRSQGLLKGGSSLTLCTEFFDWSHLKSTLFKDLTGLFQLSTVEKKAFLAHTHAKAERFCLDNVNSKQMRSSWLHSEINSLKLDYYLVVSQQRNRTNKRLLSAFVGNCLRLYKLSLLHGVNREEHGIDSKEAQRNPTERHVGDDAVILAVMALVHLWRAGHMNALLRGTLLLERAIEVSKHNYDALLLAVRFYLYLGMVGRAMEIYHKLGIKNLQFTNTAWVLFTRISTLHPHDSRKIDCQPLFFLRKMRDFIDTSVESLRSTTAKHIREGSLRNLLQTLEVFGSGEKYISSMVLASELEEVEWVADLGKVPVEPPARYWIDPADNRDVRGFANYEARGQQTIEAILRPGPLPQMSWVTSKIKITYLRRWLFNLGSSDPEAFEHTWKTQDSVIWGDGHWEKSEDSTEAENEQARLLYDTFHLIAQVASAVEQPDRSWEIPRVKWFVGTVNELLTDFEWPPCSLRDNLRTGRGWFAAIGWELFHEAYTTHSQMRLYFSVLRTMAILERSTGIDYGFGKTFVTDCLVPLERAACWFHDSLVSSAKELQGLLKEPKAVDSLLDDLAAKEDEFDEVADELCASEAMEDLTERRVFCARVVENYVDMLDGIVGLDSDWLRRA